MSYFTLEEPATKTMSGQLSPPYSIGSIPAPIHEVARILTGSIDYRIPSENRTVRPRTNYLTQAGALHSPASVMRSISEDLADEDYSRFLDRSKYKNIEFFKRLKNEIAQCILYKETGNHTEGFIHLFRSIEFMAEACGILYVSHQDDFVKSMEFFKAISAEESIGPLGLLSRTALHIARHEGLGDVTFDYEPSSINVAYLPLVGSQLRSIGVPELKNIVFLWDGVTGYKISVRFADVPEFIAVLRNRMYHNQRERANIDLYRIGGFSGLAQMIISPTLSWLATMYFTLLRALIIRAS